MNKYSYTCGNLIEYLRGQLGQINLQHGITDLKKQKITRTTYILCDGVGRPLVDQTGTATLFTSHNTNKNHRN